MKIGIFGFDFVSSNKGCLALTYTFLNMIENITNGKDVEIINFSYKNDLGNIAEHFPRMKFENFQLSFNKIYRLNQTKKCIKKCDIFFDATFGDGFSDIYGVKWNIVTNLLKQMVINQKVPLVLMPQTYGPFNNKFLEKWSMNIIKKSKVVYTRDKLSKEYVYKKCKCDINQVSDLAFKLEYQKNKYPKKSEKIAIGINISSLLWDGEWVENNHFNLKVDYKRYTKQLIEYLIGKNGKYEIHIIPHVIDLERPNHRENDYRACLEMKNTYGDNVIIAPPFDNPIDAKSYISNMDIFIGARMHATIAAISSGVATIPFSYSRKFEGLYGTIGYNYLISARNIDTEDAISQTKEWIDNYKKLKVEGKKSKEIALKDLGKLEKEIKKLVENIE